MGEWLKNLVLLVCGSLLLGSWLFACSGQEPQVQQQRRLELARAQHFFSRELAQCIQQQGIEGVVLEESRFVLHYRAGALSEVREQLKLHGYTVATTNAAFQRITVNVDSPEQLEQLRAIALISAVGLTGE